MSTVNAAQAKDRLPSLLQAAERGEVVTITRYGRPVAELRGVPVPQRAPRMSGREAGAWLDAELAKINLPKDLNAMAILQAMRDERDEF